MQRKKNKIKHKLQKLNKINLNKKTKECIKTVKERKPSRKLCTLE